MNQQDSVMIHVIGIGPGDPELLTLKAARILARADIIFVPQSNADGRSVADAIIAPHAAKEKIRRVHVSMRSDQRGADPVYTALAEEMAAAARNGSRVAYVSIGDTLLYSTGQYLGERFAALGEPFEYVPGIPSFIAAASFSRFALASGTENLLLAAMPDNVDAVVETVAKAGTVAFFKINKRLPVLLDYVRAFRPAKAVLLHRMGLDREQSFDLAAAGQPPQNIGYLSIALIRRAW